MPHTILVRLRTICLALPETREVKAWGEPTFRVRSKMFAMHADAANHHGSGRPAVWLKAAPGNQALMIKAAPQRFFAPPYVGSKGWVGIWLDGNVPWAAVRQLVCDAYRLTAPKRLVAQLEGAAPKPKPRRKQRRRRRQVLT